MPVSLSSGLMRGSVGTTTGWARFLFLFESGAVSRDLSVLKPHFTAGSPRMVSDPP